MPAIIDVLRAWDGAYATLPELPDEPPRDPEQLSWSAGSLDGVMGRHAAPGAAQDSGRRVLAALRAGDLDALSEVGHAFATADADAILECVSAEPGLDGVAVVRQLLATASERGPVKLAIVLLGVLGDHSDVADLMTLARHDEFTLYCAVALSGLLADPVDALWQVAQVTHGWGKVETVERLAPAARGRPDIQRWLLTDGCANAVMNEYLAYPCAVHGGLAEALQGPVDDALLDGACTIVSALISGGPAEDISDYEDADVVVERLVGLLGERCTLERLRTVVALRDRDPRCDAILAHPRWPEVVRAGFRDGVWVWDLAEAVEVDLFEDAFARLDEFVFGDVWHLMRDDARSARVVGWAEAALPLDELASGPALHLFPADHQGEREALGNVVGALGAELWSDRLVAAALLSPVISTRNAALNAIEARGAYGAPVRLALVRLGAEEPSPEVLARVSAL